MKKRIARYATDQKAFLSSIERSILAPAESAGEPDLIIETDKLKRILEIAKRAPRSLVGRPSNSLQPKTSREYAVAKAREKIAKLKADGKKPGGKPATGEQISAIISELASDLNVSESTAADLVTRKLPRKKKSIASKVRSAPSGESEEISGGPGVGSIGAEFAAAE
jgi:hypothetical protein